MSGKPLESSDDEMTFRGGARRVDLDIAIGAEKPPFIPVFGPGRLSQVRSRFMPDSHRAGSE
jgi:hypothetical protein